MVGTPTHGLTFQQGFNLNITAFSDPDWARDSIDRRSTTVFVVFLRSNRISWSETKQKIVSRSSTEAEYRALATTAAEIFWLRQLLRDLQVFGHQPPLLLCDNQSIIQRARNPVFHGRTKHIEVDFYYVRERVTAKDIDLSFVPTTTQLADLFTKPLTSHRLHFLKSKLMP